MNALQVKLCRTRIGTPLATVDGLPGGDADMTPAQLRALAETLQRIADEAEGRPMDDKRYRPIAKCFPVEPATGIEIKRGA